MTSKNIHPINLLASCYIRKWLQAIVNSVDPDELASKKPTDMDIQCFRNRIRRYLCSRLSIIYEVRIRFFNLSGELQSGNKMLYSDSTVPNNLLLLCKLLLK